MQCMRSHHATAAQQSAAATAPVQSAHPDRASSKGFVTAKAYHGGRIDEHPVVIALRAELVTLQER
jgi:hypothetical protein